MPEAVSHVKDPKRVEIGRRAMRARWGEPRRLRLDQLEPSIRAAVLALIDANDAAVQARSRNGSDGS